MRLLIILFFISLGAQAQLVGKVVSIADGDTFTMLVEQKKIKVRLYGIDCPEKGQDYANVARDFTADLIAGKNVVLKVLNTDRYRRTIGMVFINGINVNEALLKNGLAWQFRKYDKYVEWTVLENNAKQKKLNIWSRPNPIPPWEWRRRKAAMRKSHVGK
jgi:endonuclease YncB( thermonuclease family)